MKNISVRITPAVTDRVTATAESLASAFQSQSAISCYLFSFAHLNSNQGQVASHTLRGTRYASLLVLPADSGPNLSPQPCRDVCSAAVASVLLAGGPVVADTVLWSCSRLRRGRLQRTPTYFKGNTILLRTKNHTAAAHDGVLGGERRHQGGDALGMRRQDYFGAGEPGLAEAPREGREAPRRPRPPPGGGGPRRLPRGGRARGAEGRALPELGPHGAPADGAGARAASGPGDDQEARRGRGVAALDVLPHVPGDGDHGVPIERRDPRAGAADCGARVSEDDEALRPDGGHGDGRRDRTHRDLNEVALPRSARGVSLRVLAGQGAQVDTTIAGGRLVFGIFAALAEFERDLIRERTVAGLEAARARGRKGGRKFALSKAQVRLAQSAMAHRDTSVSRAVPRAQHQAGDALPVRRPTGSRAGRSSAPEPEDRDAGRA